jgi:uncharacterized membrane protein YesL
MTSKVPASFRVIGRSFVDWWDGWLDMVVVTSLWLLAQFTILLGPPATFGLYHVVHNMINGEATGARGMIAGGKKYFLKSWVWGVINILVIVTIYINYIFYAGIEAVWGLFVSMFVILLAVLWASTQFYALAYFFEQDTKKLRIAMRNGIFTTLAAPFFTFALLIIVAAVIVLSLGLVIPFFLGLPALVPFLGFRAMLNRLEAFGLREREKTPKEIEYEQSSKIEVPGSGGSSRGENTARSEVAKSKRQVEEKEKDQSDRL